ncbi:hypothetical protein [Gemmobacter sp. 24YEA27]|uniref:hypothetical protein n=1 Tax=Gemmobacter sp. 24YEA27 TaxID=3040672 RepID=UPI0024B35F74|nr:hypothetical protein [Gemmobacter sp. 24YEA27]
MAGFQHGQQIVGQDRLLLARRRGVAVADAREDVGEVPVEPVKDKAALRLGQTSAERRRSMV